MEPTDFWRDLKTEFLKLYEEQLLYLGQGALGALWDGQKWHRSGGYDADRISWNFGQLAKSAAVRLGHAVEPTGVAFWLDLLKAKTGAYLPIEHTLLESDFKTAGGKIELVCKVSAEYCRSCETQEIVQQRAQAPMEAAPHQQPSPQEPNYTGKEAATDTPQEPVAPEPPTRGDGASPGAAGGGVQESDAGQGKDGNEAVFRKMADFWEVKYHGRTNYIKDSQGMHFIARFLGAPGREIACIDLFHNEEQPLRLATAVGMGFQENLSVGGSLGDAGPLLTPETIENYKQRLRDLPKERENAKDDPVISAELENEFASISRELKSATDSSGKPRKAASSDDRARSNATMQIKAAIKKISEENKELGLHLGKYINTGKWCSYNPYHSSNIRWTL